MSPEKPPLPPLPENIPGEGMDLVELNKKIEALDKRIGELISQKTKEDFISKKTATSQDSPESRKLAMEISETVNQRASYEMRKQRIKYQRPEGEAKE